jgi:hypothetical protein
VDWNTQRAIVASFEWESGMARRDRGVLTGDPVTYQTSSPAGGVRMETFIPWTLVKRGVKRQVVTPIDAPEAFRVEAAAEPRGRFAAEDTPLVRAASRTTGNNCWTEASTGPSPRSLLPRGSTEARPVGSPS